MVMIREVDSLVIGMAPSPLGGAAVPVLTPTTDSIRARVESTEQEIARLTWSVLDGSASLSDRQRLAELVNAQHAVRRRIDR
jgi:hypothetical protein